MSAVPESVEAKRPDLKTLAQFERTGIEKLGRRYVPHLFPICSGIPDESALRSACSFILLNFDKGLHPSSETVCALQ
jgi:hypothetical protein